MTQERRTKKWMVWWMAATVTAAVGIGALLVPVPQAAVETEDVPFWQSCFGDPLEALQAGAEPETALASVEAAREEATRLAGLHQAALTQLHQDRRWDQEDQVEWMTEAVIATTDTVSQHQAEADDAMATAGCIENEH